MSDKPRPFEEQPFEEELRQALHSGSEDAKPPGADDDSAELLHRIHRGAARRRARRRVGAIFATAVLAGAATLVVPLLKPTPSDHKTAGGPVSTSTSPRVEDGAKAPKRARLEAPSTAKAHPPKGGGPPPRPPAPPPRAGEPVEVESLAVTSVSGSAEAEEFWVAGAGTCAQDRTCSVLGHTEDGGEDLDYRLLPVDSGRTETIVRFSGDSENGWATNGVETFRTVDGGGHWLPLRQPADVAVTTLEAWGDEVWAVGDGPAASGDIAVLREGEAGDRLRQKAYGDFDTEQAVAIGEGTFGVLYSKGPATMVRTADGGEGWDFVNIGCRAADISATAGAVVWALCGGDEPALVRSLDQGETWLEPEPLDLTLSDPSALDGAEVAAVSDSAAFVAAGSEGWVVETGSAPTAAEGLGGSPYRYAGFTTESTGYLIAEDGHLCRTVDGGLSWDRVELP